MFKFRPHSTNFTLELTIFRMSFILKYFIKFKFQILFITLDDSNSRSHYTNVIQDSKLQDLLHFETL